MIKQSIETFTPELAKYILDHKNTRNRPISRQKAEEYARDMRSGLWTIGQDIIFYEDGILADGQTRLTAVIMADIAIISGVKRGLKIKDGANLDRGRSRSIPNAVSISGQSDIVTKDTVSIIRLLCCKWPFKPSVSDIVRISGDLYDSLSFIKVTSFSKQRGLSSAAIKSAILRSRENGMPETRLTSFVKIFNTGIYKNDSDIAPIRLRNHLLDHAELSGGGHYQQSLELKAEYAIRAFCEQRPIKNITLPKDHIYELTIMP